MKTTKVKKIIGHIHAIKNELRLSDEDYRAVLSGAGIESCSEITDEVQGQIVLSQFRSLQAKLKKQALQEQQEKRYGFKNARAGSGGKNRMSERQEYYLRGLWNLCMKNAYDESSLEAFCKRVTGTASLAWLSKKDASDCITALKRIARQKGFDPDKPISQN